MAGKKAKNAKKRRQRVAAAKLRETRSRYRNITTQAFLAPLCDLNVMQNLALGITAENGRGDGCPNVQQIKKPIFTCPYECIPSYVAQDRAGRTLVPGDHIRVPMWGGLYNHEGLFLGGISVIHYSGMAGSDSAGSVELIPIHSFADREDIEVVPHAQPRFSRDESIERALGRLMESRYDLVTNNCEHFVNWCIEGEHRSNQVNSAIRAVAHLVALSLFGRTR